MRHRPCNLRKGAVRSLGWGSLLGLALLLLTAPTLAQDGQPQDLALEMELTTPVWQKLHRLQEIWQLWVNAYHRNDRDHAEAAVEEMQSIASYLGMPKLPELSIAAAAHAALAAQEEDGERARWVLAAARQLDPERPETDFAEAAVHRFEGSYLGALNSSLRGYIRLLRLPIERSLWLQNLAIWAFYTLTVTGGLFIALQMGLRGGGMLTDIVGFLPVSVPPGLASVLAVVLLIWPLFLPSGVLWLALYWSVLLWGYGSTSERAVMIVLWLALGAVPLLLSLQQRYVRLSLAPPVRAIETVVSGRLYGLMFADLSLLKSMIPNHPVYPELIADLHRKFGQWEYARLIYDDLRDQSDLTSHNFSVVLNNLGVYYHRKGDYGTAINYFRAANEADSLSAEALFNLSQAYSLAYQYQEANDALEGARRIDSHKVDQWLDGMGDDPAEAVIQIDGGLQRRAEIRRALDESWSANAAGDQGRRFLGFAVALVLLGLAFAVERMRYSRGLDAGSTTVGPRGSSGRWLRAFVPGLGSAVHHRGGRAFLGLLVPVGLLMVPLMAGLGFRIPVGYSPGSTLSLGFCIAALSVWFLARLGWELTDS